MKTTTPEKKRPGGSGNFPEPLIQQSPARKTDMDTNSTEAAYAQAKGNPDIPMESILHNVHDMADVAAELLSKAFGQSHEALTGRCDMFWLSEREVDLLLFSAFQTVRMAREAIDSYCESIGLGMGDEK